MEQKRIEIEALLKQKKLLKIIPLLSLLEREFPATFNRENPLPLKIGVKEDLFNLIPKVNDENFSKKKINRVLKYYTRLPKYIAICEEGRGRVDLAGLTSDDKVTQEQANFMREELAQRPLVGISSNKISRALKMSDDEIKAEEERLMLAKKSLKEDEELRKRKAKQALNKMRKERKKKRKN